MWLSEWNVATFNVQLDESYRNLYRSYVQKSKQQFCKASPVAEPNLGRARGINT